MTRLHTTSGAFEAWMQSVEDRLKQLQRFPRRQSATIDELAVARLIVGELTVTTIEAASTLGAVTGRIALLDPDGRTIGYLPVYDTIT